jgi:IclR family transcriptional regulator, KDG regulon repressor
MPEISRTADQALGVLLAVSEHGPVTASRLTRLLGINRTVVNRLLSTLRGRGFVIRAADGYVLGAILLRMAGHVAPALRDAALPVMERLSEATQETVVLQVPDGSDVVVVAQTLGTAHLVRVEHRLGSRHPMHLGASGRAMLAFQAPRAIDQVLRGVQDAERIRAALADIRARRYAVSRDELRAGVHGFAAPVLNGSDQPVAALAILVPETRAGTMPDPERFLHDAAREIRVLLLGSAASAA